MTEVFEKVCELGIALGWKNIAGEVGCTEWQVDESWWFAINPHGEACKCSKGAMVPAGHVYLQFNGWPFGLVNWREGMCGAGRVANEDALIAALERATERVKNGNS
jgi:hypothetical protein